jgi:hypothetical protein
MTQGTLETLSFRFFFKNKASQRTVPGPPGMHQGLAAAAHNSSRKQGRESDDLLGWHNRSLRSSATRRKGPTILHKLRTLCGSLKELARSNASSEPSLLAAEWPKPEDIVLDAVYKKVRPGTLAHTRTFARTFMHANEIRG